jgi:uracil-DNA glycosylase family 4
MLREIGVQLWSHESGASDAAVVAERREAPVPVPASTEAPPARAPAPQREPIATASTAKLAPADWLFVGEPFDGVQQEQLLDNMLRAIGVARSAPARERRATFVALTASTPDAPADCDELATAIATVAPRGIVALGRAAAAALLGSDAPLGHWRGRRHERAALPVVVTFSLAFLLRHPEEKAKAWADLCLAVAAIAPPVT